MASPRHRNTLAPAPLALAAAWLLAAGCNLDISRVRVNVPLDREGFRRLEVGRSTFGEALDTLGAPDEILYRGDLQYLYWLHQDTISAGIRFQSPISVFGYRHTLARLDVDAEETSSLRLVFRPDGLLVDKSLRLAPGFVEPEAEIPGWALYLIPRYGYSPILFGDGGEEGYEDLFSHGQTYGGHLGLLPAPYFMLLLGGNYQVYEGDSFPVGGQRARMEDLHVYTLEIGGRFQVPPRFFVDMWDVQKLKALFYSEDHTRHRGAFIFFQWTLGGAFNEEVGVELDGAKAGSYFEKALGFVNTLGLGAEYRLTHLGLQATAEYQIINGFESGDTAIDNSAGDFNNFIFTGGLSLRF